ncbi:MAG: CoA pyrophosphatase [Neisseriaceae bacterium]|nr:CoA pyrophosphatase [Neisseriaceae bacterium]
MGEALLLSFLQKACAQPWYPDQALRDYRLDPDQAPISSAILMPFVPIAAEWHVLLTVRSACLKNHAGEVCLPGGKFDQTDQNLIQTALRETEEELHIAPKQVSVVGSMPIFQTLTGYDVTPVLGVLASGQAWRANAEVADVFTIPLSWVLDVDHYQERVIHRTRGAFTCLALPYEGYDVWGATASMLYRLAWLQQQLATEDRV